MMGEPIERTIANYVRAIQRRDLAAMVAEHSPTCVCHTMLAGKIEGRAAIESFYRTWFTAFEETELNVDAQFIDGNRAAIFWRQRGTHRGEFCGLAATGRRFEMRGAFLMEFEEGAIVSFQSVYDFTGLLLKLGVLKAKPGF
jgi:steroid delta-isomerase-like uncharacterized protein